MDYPSNLILAKREGLKTNKDFRKKFYNAFGFNIKSILMYQPIFLSPNLLWILLYKFYRGMVFFIKPWLKPLLKYLKIY